MSSFLQYGSFARPGPALRPVVIGALTCSALLISTGTAQAHHRMADGTLCPHAAGTLGAGESKSAPTVERSASAGPLGAPKAAPRAAAPKPAARPAPTPAAKAPVQRPAVQAQAQKPAASQAQAQRPATATQQAVSQTRVAVPAQRQARVGAPAQRQAPAAKPSSVKQPQARTSQRSAAKQRVAAPAVKPAVTAEITTDRRGAIERPTAAPVAVDSGAPAPVAVLAALLGLFAAIIVAGVAAVRRRVVRVETAAPSPTLAESMDAAIEAELQQIIVETRARALRAPAGLDEEHEDRELSQTY